MTKTPAVTVLMAVHNGAPFVGDAVRSILDQTFTNFEFLIVDDASTDATVQTISAFRDRRIRLLRNQENLGLTRSLNRGLVEASAALIARQDADDVSHPSRLADQVTFLRSHPIVAVLGAQARMIDVRGRRVRAAPWPKSTTARAVRWQLMFDSPFIHTSVMFRRDIVREDAHGYNETFTTSQDFELWCRLAAAGHVMCNLPETLVDLRLHGGSVSARYELENVMRLRPVLLESAISQIGREALPSGWPDAWISLNNPRLFPGGLGAPREMADALGQMHRAFVARSRDREGTGEIRRHLAATLIRVATLTADRGHIRSLHPFVRACRLDPVLAVQATPRYLANLAFGRLRSRGGTAAAERTARRG